jgi:hypothetical protein
MSLASMPALHLSLILPKGDMYGFSTSSPFGETQASAPVTAARPDHAASRKRAAADSPHSWCRAWGAALVMGAAAPVWAGGFGFQAARFQALAQTSPTPTYTPFPPTATATATRRPTPTPSRTATRLPSPTPVASPTGTPMPTATPAPTPTHTVAPSPTSAPLA